MIWEKCIPDSLYKFICCKVSFMLLNQLEVTYQKASQILNNFIQNEKKTADLHLYFQEF